MAEVPDPSAGGSEAVQPAPGITAAPWEAGGGLAPMPEPEKREAYRPLSLLALAGFLISVVYALVVLIGAAAALYYRTPWLLPPWTFLIPAATALLCWAARVRIQASEETLAGRALATWGIGLCLFFGLNYAAYFASTYFAVRQQAGDFAREWLRQIEQGRVDRAFLLTLPPSSRPREDANLIRRLEEGYGRPASPTAPGPYTMFRQMDFIRMIRQTGPATRVDFLGVAGWEYDKGGYQVQLRYRVGTAIAAFDLIVTVRSSESPAGESGGRRWQVLNSNTNIAPDGTVVPTPEGDELQSIGMRARRFAFGWTQLLSERQLEKAYLDTLPPQERERQRKAREKPDAARGKDPAYQDFQKGLKAFEAGGIVRTDPQNFWAPPAFRGEMVRIIKDLFRPGAESEADLTVQDVRIPLVTREGNRLRLALDTRVMIRDPQNPRRPRYVVEGFLVVEADAPKGDSPVTVWRVKAFELTSGHGSPHPGKQQRGVGE